MTDLRGDKRFLVTGQVSQYDVFGIDFSMNNSFWGITFCNGHDGVIASSTNNCPSGPSGANIAATCPGATPANDCSKAAINVRQGIAHLISRDGFIIQNLGGQGYRTDCFAPYLQLAPPKGGGQLLCPNRFESVPSVPANGNIPTWNVCDWDKMFPNCQSSYSLGSSFDSHGAVLKGSPDFCAAADHFIAAGIASGKDPTTCVLRNLSSAAQTQSVNLWVPHGESGKMLRTLGDTLTYAINYLFGRPSPAVVECIAGSNGSDAIAGIEGHFLFPGESSPSPDLRPLVQGINQYLLVGYNAATACQGPWQMAALGWNLSQNPDQFYTLYNSQSSFNSYSNNAFDHWSRMIEYNNTGDSNYVLSAESAEYILGSDAVNIPIWSDFGQFVYLNGWTNVVNQQGLGTPNSWTALNAWAAQPPNSDVLRWGLEESTSRLNVFTSVTSFDRSVLGEIYEPLFIPNPYSPAQIIGWLTNNYSFPDSGTSGCPTSLTEAGSVVSIAYCLYVTLRGDASFHDVASCGSFDSVCLENRTVTASDVKFSLLNLRLENVVDVLYPASALPKDAFGAYGGTGSLGQTETFYIALHSKSPFDLANLALVPIVPQHVWHSNGAVGPCLNAGSPQCTVEPSFVNPGQGSDPVLNTRLIGSGPFECKGSGGIGGGCTSAGGSNIGPGGSISLGRFGAGLDQSYAYFRTSSKFQQFQWAAFPGGSTVPSSAFVNVINACKASATNVGGVVNYAACQHYNTPSDGLACVSTAGACIGVTSGGHGSLPSNPDPILIQVSHWRNEGPSWAFGVPSYNDLAGAQAMPQTLYEDGSVEGGFGIVSSSTVISAAVGVSARATISVYLSGIDSNDLFPAPVPVDLGTVESSGLTAGLSAPSITLNPATPTGSFTLSVSASSAGTYTVIVKASSGTPPNFPSVTVTITVNVT